MGYSNNRSGAFFGTAVVAALLGAAGIASTAHAGTVLLARESSIRASGSDGADSFDLADGSQDFTGFADVVDSVEAGYAGPRSAANQHSRPALRDHDGAFTGAFAEGSVSTEAGATPDGAEAVSHFDLTFEVVGVPSVVNFGGSLGVAGNGSTTIALSNETTGELVLTKEVLAGTEDGQSIEHHAVLKPGVYELWVQAAAVGEPTESMAYYTVSLSLAPVDFTVTPIPLPPAVWSAAGLLATGGGLGGLRRLRRARDEMRTV